MNEEHKDPNPPDFSLDGVDASDAEQPAVIKIGILGANTNRGGMNRRDFLKTGVSVGVVAATAMTMGEADAAHQGTPSIRTAEVTPQASQSGQVCQRTYYTAHQIAVNDVGFRSDGSMIVSCGAAPETSVLVWNAFTGELVRRYTGHSGTVKTVAFHPNDAIVASGGSDHSVHIWDAATGILRFIYRGHSDNIERVAFSPSGNRVVSLSLDGDLQVWDAFNGRLVTRFGNQNVGMAFSALALSPDENKLAMGTRSGVIFVSNRGLLLRYAHHADAVNALAFDPSGTRLASVGSDRHVHLWDAETGELIFQYSLHISRVNALAFTPDGAWVVSGSADNTVQVWNAVTGQRVRQYTGHRDNINALAVSSDGTKVVSGCQDGTLHVWELNSGSELLAFQIQDTMHERREEVPCGSGGSVIGCACDLVCTCDSVCTCDAMCTCDSHAPCTCDAVCTCDNHTVCTCDAVCTCQSVCTCVSVCTCQSVCNCVGNHYWYPN